MPGLTDGDLAVLAAAGYAAYADATGHTSVAGAPIPASLAEVDLSRVHEGWRSAAHAIAGALAAERQPAPVARRTFEEWLDPQPVPDPGDPSSSARLARSAWNTALAQHSQERDAMLADLGELLRALGMFDGAQPSSPHELMQAAITEVRRRLISSAVLTPAVMTPAAATVHCSACGQPLQPKAVPVGEVFILQPHDCPNQPTSLTQPL